MRVRRFNGSLQSGLTRSESISDIDVKYSDERSELSVKFSIALNDSSLGLYSFQLGSQYKTKHRTTYDIT
jgi:hypothetical protein